MKKKIEITVKCDNETQAADALETIAAQLRGAGFHNAPNDIREMEDEAGRAYGFYYDVCENNGTDVYGNVIE